MTATLLIQPDERELWTPGARRWWGIEPVYCDGSDRCPAPRHMHGCYRSTAADEGNGVTAATPQIPPEWAAFTQPCLTCGGRSTLKRLSILRAGTVLQLDSQNRPCPDCFEGHPTTDLRIPCDGCDGLGTVDLTAEQRALAAHGNAWAWAGDDLPGDEDCDGCDGEGFVSVGRVYTTASQWLPTIDPFDITTEPPYIRVYPSRSPSILNIADQIEGIVLDGFAEPGGWAIHMQLTVPAPATSPPETSP